MTSSNNSLLDGDVESVPNPPPVLPNLPRVVTVGIDSLPTDHLHQLEEAGFCVLPAPLGSGLTGEIKALKPDVILASDALNGSSPDAICRLIQHDVELMDIPLLLFGTHPPTPEGMAQGLTGGAEHYLDQTQPLPVFLACIQAAYRHKLVLGKTKSLANQLNEDYTVLYDRNLAVEKELYITRQLQQSLLPKVINDPTAAAAATDASLMPQFAKCHYKDERVRISGVYIPCDSLGGDLYDVIRFNNETIGITIADVSGHGVPAAFVTAIFKAAFYRMTNTYESPGDILYHLNNELYHIVKTGEYVTCIYCRIKENGTKLEYTGAGHPYPIHYRAEDKTLDRLKENGTPLVWLKDMEYPMGEVPLAPGDKVLIFTDGISEIKNPQRDLFGEPALEELFSRLIQEHPNAILDKMVEALSDFTQGHPLEDDMSIVLIEVLED